MPLDVIGGICIPGKLTQVHEVEGLEPCIDAETVRKEGDIGAIAPFTLSYSKTIRYRQQFRIHT